MRSALTRLAAALAVVAAAAAAPQPADAQGLIPTVKPVRIVVPGPPGGPAGVMAQMIATKVAPHLNQTVIVEYKPGAGGNIAMEYVAKAAPDGYTLFFSVPAVVTNPYFQKVSLDPFLLAPVIQLNSGPFLMLVHPSDTAKSVADVVAQIKASPGNITCASGPVALSTVSCHLLQSYAGPMLMVAYPGNAQASAALSRGEIKILFDFMNTAGGAVKDGRLRALAITSKERSSGEFKDLPPIGDTVPGFDLIGWQGIMAPKDTPQEIIVRLNEALNKVLAEEDVKQLYRVNGIEMAGGTPAAFGDRVKRDYEFYGRVAKEAKIEPQ
jgi:tripartite-type tricarboxylate transporter receptor subunit TctC